MGNNHSKQIPPPAKGTCARFMYKKYGAESCAQSPKWEKWTSTATPKLRWPPGGSFETDVMEYLQLVLSEQNKTFVDWRAFTLWKVESLMRQKQNVVCHPVPSRELKTSSSCGHPVTQLGDPSPGSLVLNKESLNNVQDSSLLLPSTKDSLEDFTLKCESLAENFGLSHEELEAVLRAKKTIELILQKNKAALAASDMPKRTSASKDKITVCYDKVWKHYRYSKRSEIDWRRVYDCKQLECENPLTYLNRLDHAFMYCGGFEMTYIHIAEKYLVDRFVNGLNTKLGNALKEKFRHWLHLTINYLATEAEKLHSCMRNVQRRGAKDAATAPLPLNVQSAFLKRPKIFFQINY